MWVTEIEGTCCVGTETGDKGIQGWVLANRYLTHSCHLHFKHTQSSGANPAAAQVQFLVLFVWGAHIGCVAKGIFIAQQTESHLWLAQPIIIVISGMCRSCLSSQFIFCNICLSVNDYEKWVKIFSSHCF